MGVERVVTFPAGSPPAWAAVADKLRAFGEAPVLRMIDGLPAFPDETPADDWRELRVGLAAGMVTLRRTSPTSIACVTWGTDDPALAAALDHCCRAIAAE